MIANIANVMWAAKLRTVRRARVHRRVTADRVKLMRFNFAMRLPSTIVRPAIRHARQISNVGGGIDSIIHRYRRRERA